MAESTPTSTPPPTSTPVIENREKPNRLGRLGIIALVLAVLAIGLFAGYALNSYLNSQSNTGTLSSSVSNLEGQVSSLNSEIAALEAGGNYTYNSSASLNPLYESVKDSIVTVEGLEAETSVGFFGTTTTYEEVLGSGFVVNLTGTPVIVTNYHVIDDMINGSITFDNGEAYAFKVLGQDPYSDLAVLEPLNAPSDLLKPLTVVSSQTLLVGDPVVAVGNPYGLQSTLTSGIVSQLNRAIQETTAGDYLISGLIQISTPINPGNSGGPLLDSQGQVVGITAAIISGSNDVGFAIPSDAIIREINSLVTTGSYTHPYLGISGVTLDYITSQAAGLNITYGVLIQSVTSGSPADKAGLKGGTETISVAGESIMVGGDVIIQIDGNHVGTMDDLTSYLEEHTVPGQTVDLTVIRGGSTLNIPVVLGSRS
jgi:S1-C subfamily serine protease